jgi:phosphotriesterase-related protein
MRTAIHFLTGLMLAATLSCGQGPEAIIMTVKGPLPASEIGMSLSHEHVLVDFIGADSTGYHRWDKEKVINKVLPYLSEIREYQVSTLMECTPAYLGRDPWILETLSEQTGLHIITNTGFYGAHNNLFIPAKYHALSAEEIAQIWVDEFENGIDGSGVRPGFIKIAVDENDTLSVIHQKIIHAAALAHQQTGMIIASHTGPDGPAFEQISVLLEHDVDPSAFIWVHAQRGSLEGNIKAARLGSWISLDNVNLRRKAGTKYDVSWYAQRMLQLKNAGVLHRVLISHDAGWYKPEEVNGGDFRGFTGIFTDLIPTLKTLHFSEQEINQILVENPQIAFSLN